MKESDKVHKFTVQFKEAADEIGWPDIVLHKLYYNGLPSRIKDLWSRAAPPSDFEDLIQEAQCVDTRYWKRVEEKKFEAPRQADMKPTPKSYPSSVQSYPSSAHSSSHSSSHPSKHHHQQHKSSSSTPSASSSSKPQDVANLLGANGKLMPEERARQEHLGLCTYCGDKHALDACPKKPAKTDRDLTSKSSSSFLSKPKPTNGNHGSKGRVVQVVKVADDDGSPESADSSF